MIYVYSIDGAVRFVSGSSGSITMSVKVLPFHKAPPQDSQFPALNLIELDRVNQKIILGGDIR